jgi:predicted transcriptional regulator YdeE
MIEQIVVDQDETLIIGIQVNYEAYADYETDHTSEYPMILGMGMTSLTQMPPKMVGIRLPRSRYMKFTANGEMLGAVQETWGRVWNYFASQDTHHRVCDLP